MTTLLDPTLRRVVNEVLRRRLTPLIGKGQAQHEFIRDFTDDQALFLAGSPRVRERLAMLWSPGLDIPSADLVDALLAPSGADEESQLRTRQRVHGWLTSSRPVTVLLRGVDDVAAGASVEWASLWHRGQASDASASA